MTETQKQFLISLVNEPGPSGYEEKVQEIWKKEVSSFCPNISSDFHGNTTATLNPECEFSIMIVGHADEVGLITYYIDDNGFIYFQRVGGVEASVLGSQRARILTRNGIIEGVFGQKSAHQEDREKKSLKIHDVYVDIGAKSKEEAMKYVRIGDPIIFGNDYQQLLDNYASARCFDNRIGIYMVAETLRKLSSIKFNTKVYGVSSVQEETGLWGARNAAYSLNPSLGIALDVMPSTDYPQISKEQFGDYKLGMGPVIRRGVRSNNKFAEKIISIAENKKHSFQIDVDNGHFWTDADPMAEIRSGIPVNSIEIPTRYLHSSVEILNLNDVDTCVNLLTDIILEIDKDKDFLKK